MKSMPAKVLKYAPLEKAARKRSPALAEEVAVALEDAIISGKLLPRERLIEVDIAAKHNVSRAPVREAFRILERHGLVSKTTQGFEVTDVTPGDAADIFEILASLEEIYTRRATPEIEQAGQQRLRKILEKMAGAAQREDISAYYALNLDFHGVIRDACPNRPLVELLLSLSKKTLRIRRFAMSISGRLNVSLQEHRRIYMAIRRGDAEGAGRYARESAERAYAAVMLMLKQTTSA